MFYVSCDKISVFVLPFFHNDLIKNSVFGIGEFNINRISVNINTLFGYCINNITYNFFCKSGIWVSVKPRDIL